jgi:hypothetical protein
MNLVQLSRQTTHLSVANKNKTHTMAFGRYDRANTTALRPYSQQRTLKEATMATNPYLDPVAQAQKDEEHLRYLVIGNYVYAAFHAIALVAMIGVVLLVSGAFAFGQPPIKAEDLPIAGAVGVFVAIVAISIPLISTVLQFLLARFLEQRKHHTYCFVISILNCLSVPIGTILGVLTLVVMMRPTVQNLFAQQRAQIDAAARMPAAHGPMG